MKKLTKVLSIISAIFAVFFLVLLITSHFKPEGFGNFLLNIYEDVTEDYGHTITGLFNRLFIIMLFSFVGAVILSIGFGIAAIKLPESKENDSEEDKKEAVTAKTISVASTAKEEKVFKKVKKQKNNKKTENQSISESVQKAADAVEKAAEKTVSTSKTIDNFLNSLKNNKL